MFLRRGATLQPSDDHSVKAPSSTAELLATLIHRGRPSATAIVLAERLLAHFGGLRGLLSADIDVLSRQRGLSAARALMLVAVAQLAERYYTETLRVGQVLSSPTDTRRFLVAKLRDLQHEVFAVIFLDTRHRILGFEALFRGTIDGTSVYPREVVKRALQRNAAALIVAHNHPSGVAEPSRADSDITQRLSDALALVDIRLLDHIVIGDNTAVSLANRGML
ncbi:MAG: DNA repair protein RadC [Pseudomonadota bacterium]